MTKEWHGPPDHVLHDQSMVPRHLVRPGLPRWVKKAGGELNRSTGGQGPTRAALTAEISLVCSAAPLIAGWGPNARWDKPLQGLVEIGFVQGQRLRRREIYDEANISTIENPAQTPARIFKPEFEQERPRDFGESAKGRSQKVDSGIIAGRWWFRGRVSVSAVPSICVTRGSLLPSKLRANAPFHEP